ncbi:MAG: adenine phosphoribosyltransferase [Clostridia bacterium]|nr:adenine phosphoribosyltransferase [Clostridia bacterium]
MELKDRIRNIPDFPQKGVLFRDITTLLNDADGYEELIDRISEGLRELDIDIVVALEARGFTVGAAVAYAIHAGLVIARKPGKLPCEAISVNYGLEYGSDTLEMHTDAIKPGQRVAIIDDLLATGGTALAAVKLVERTGGNIVAIRFAVELSDLGGREALSEYDVDSVIVF